MSPNLKTLQESRTNTVNWEHESYPIDWQHQMFKRMLYQAENEMGKESNIDDDLGNRRLSLSRSKNIEAVKILEPNFDQLLVHISRNSTSTSI